jgi:addiction module HigA family antidote
MFRNSSRRGGKVVHPGVILHEEVMHPHDISQNALARCIGVSPRRINEIVHGKRAITPETAVALEEALGIPARFWMSLQAEYDIERTRAHRMASPPRVGRPLPVLGFDEPFEEPWRPEASPLCRAPSPLSPAPAAWRLDHQFSCRDEADLEKDYDEEHHDLAVIVERHGNGP